MRQKPIRDQRRAGDATQAEAWLRVFNAAIGAGKDATPAEQIADYGAAAYERRFRPALKEKEAG